MNHGRSPNADVLVRDFLPFAMDMLRAYRELRPFGAYMANDGTVTSVTPDLSEVSPPASSLVKLLRDRYRQMAADGNVQATAVVYDSYISIPNESAKRDAIAFELDTSDGYSMIWYWPYAFSDAGQFVVESPFAISGSKEIFGRSGSPNTSLERTREG